MDGALLFNSPQGLLQQCSNLIISVLPLFVQFYQKIGRCLQCLVYCPGVLAVERQLLKPLNKSVEERESLIVDIIDSDITFSLFYHIIIFIGEDKHRFFSKGCCIDINTEKDSNCHFSNLMRHLCSFLCNKKSYECINVFGRT